MIQTKKLGSWFPSATVQKASPLKDRCTILLFYHYCRPELTKNEKQVLTTFLQETTSRLKIGGKIRVANEGINSTLSGSAEDMRAFAKALTEWGLSSPTAQSGPFFNPTPDYKYIDDLPSDRAFKDLKVFPVNELVFYGVDEKHAPLAKGGVHLDPKDYHEKMKKADTVIIDVRNHYEADIGRFDGQEKKGGAKYIDPKMRKSTDFKAWLGKEETKADLRGKNVLMYCTGGVRCERASALLNTEMGSELGGIFQLQGGIEKYLQEFPDGGHWTGKNYVFDKREAFGVGNLAGVGGVVESTKKKGKKKNGTSEAGEAISKCCVCSASWDRYIGKKKCFTCGVPVLMCSACCSLKPDKTPGKELSVRCPLCIEQNITVPAADLDLTENGIGVTSKGQRGKKIGATLPSKVGKDTSESVPGNIAPSVCKWGGGHGADKKKQRAFNKKECKFADACLRSDCYFSHPRDGNKSAAGKVNPEDSRGKRKHDKNGHSGHKSHTTKKVKIVE
eukprot:CFRG5197T1